MARRGAWEVDSQDDVPRAHSLQFLVRVRRDPYGRRATVGSYGPWTPHCPRIVPEPPLGTAYSRRFPSSESSRNSLSLCVGSTGCDDGVTGCRASNPVGDAKVPQA